MLFFSHYAIFDDDVGLLRPEKLACVLDEDKGALESQRIERPWKAVNAEKCATQKMIEFLASAQIT